MRVYHAEDLDSALDALDASSEPRADLVEGRGVSRQAVPEGVELLVGCLEAAARELVRVLALRAGCWPEVRELDTTAAARALADRLAPRAERLITFSELGADSIEAVFADGGALLASVAEEPR